MLSPQIISAKPPTLDDDKTVLQQTLDKHNWVIARAASELGISRQALYRRIEKHQLSQPEA